MESRPPSIPHPPFPRPSLFSTAPQHSGQYGSSQPQPQTSRPEARSHTAYDSLRRPADEPSRTTPTYGYAAHSYNPDLRSQARSTSPTRFGAMQSDAAKRSALASPVKNNGILGKDSAFYRDASGLRRTSSPRDQESRWSANRSRNLKSASTPAANSETSSAHTIGNRQMPPPSPPQPYPARNSSGSLSQTSSSLFSRDHGFGSIHRPGTSMSISSMLGTDPDRPSRDHPTSLFSRPAVSSPFGTSRNSTGAMSPPTAPARPASSIDHPLMRRSQTPDKPVAKDPLSRQSSRSDSGGFLDSTKFSFGRSSFSQYPEKSTTTQKSPRNATASDPPFSHSRRVSVNSAIQRPNSQAQQEETRPPAYSPRTRASGDSIFGTTHRNTSYLDDTRPFARFGGLYSDRAREEQLAREREKERNTAQETERKPAFGLLHGRYGVPPTNRDEDRPQNRPSWEIGRSQPKSPEARRFTTASESGSRSGFGFGAIQSYTKSLGSQLGASRSAPATTPSHPSFSLHSRQQSQPTPPPHEQSFLGKTQPQPRPLSVTSVPSASQPSLGASGSAAADEQRRKGSEDLIQHRTLLGIGADGKRAGRASPLPQAVQGAQAQFIGSAGETGIKAELGRVFAGIGSGVGTGPSSSTGSGPPTPMTASPFKRDSFGASEHADEGKGGRGGAALGRKRSSKDEEPSDLAEQAQELRGTPSTRGGSRRGRHVHHHHHHHHHHRYKNEDEGVAPRTTTATTNVLGKAPAPAEPVPPVATTTPAHHHHHHHHHHHAPRNVTSITSAPAVVPLRDARTLVNIKPLLESVAQLPRHHLGSTLYAPRIGMPSANSSGESQKFGYTSTPVPIPRFEGKENCTFTIRVPRFRIDPSHREEICARRAVWGTGVYTDDSDPVAAAIHSGFIRGEWGEDVDISMLDLEIKSDYHHAPQPAAEPGATAKPSIPPVPPPNKDLHITLLILPRLERYESTLMFGLKSRAWDGNHDGMSFKVERIEWVDEGSTRGEERSGAARRKRLRNMMQTGRICTGPGLLRLRGGPGSLLVTSTDMVTGQAPASAPVQPVS